MGATDWMEFFANLRTYRPLRARRPETSRWPERRALLCELAAGRRPVTLSLPTFFWRLDKLISVMTQRPLVRAAGCPHPTFGHLPPSDGGRINQWRTYQGWRPIRWALPMANILHPFRMPRDTDDYAHGWTNNRELYLTAQKMWARTKSVTALMHQTEFARTGCPSLGSAPALGAIFRALAEIFGRTENGQARLQIAHAGCWARGRAQLRPGRACSPFQVVPASCHLLSSIFSPKNA